LHNRLKHKALDIIFVTNSLEVTKVLEKDLLFTHLKEVNACNMIEYNIENYLISFLNPKLPEGLRISKDALRVLIEELPYTWGVIYDYVENNKYDQFNVSSWELISSSDI